MDNRVVSEILKLNGECNILVIQYDFKSLKPDVLKEIVDHTKYQFNYDKILIMPNYLSITTFSKKDVKSIIDKLKDFYDKLED